MSDIYRYECVAKALKNPLRNLTTILEDDPFLIAIKQLDKEAHEKLTGLIEEAGYMNESLKCEFNTETSEELWYSGDKLIFTLHPLEFFEQDGDNFINNKITARIRITPAP